MTLLKKSNLSHFQRLKRIGDKKWCIERVCRILKESKEEEISEKKVNRGVKRKKLICQDMKDIGNEYCEESRLNLMNEIKNCKNVNEESIFLGKISNLSVTSYKPKYDKIE